MLDDSRQRAKELQRQYLKKWRKQNPEKVKKYNRDYWIRKAEKERKNNEPI